MKWYTDIHNFITFRFNACNRAAKLVLQGIGAGNAPLTKNLTLLLVDEEKTDCPDFLTCPLLLVQHRHDARLFSSQIHVEVI